MRFSSIAKSYVSWVLRNVLKRKKALRILKGTVIIPEIYPPKLPQSLALFEREPLNTKK
jgi:hypothetical protein